MYVCWRTRIILYAAIVWGLLRSTESVRHYYYYYYHHHNHHHPYVGIYNYIYETNHVSRAHSSVAIL